MIELYCTPSFVSGLAWFRVVHASDAQAQQAADRIVAQLQVPPIRYQFQQGVLRVASLQADPGVVHAVTATSCSCRGGRHPWCVHRVLYRVLLAERTLLAAETAPRPPSDTAAASAARAHAYAEIDELFA